MRTLSKREWTTVILGGGLTLVVLVWSFLVGPGLDQLKSNAKQVETFSDNISKIDKQIKEGEKLAAENKALETRYTNALESISKKKMPDNLFRELRREFGKLDEKYQSTITSTDVRQPQTNGMYSYLAYKLKDVKCDWKSLNAALGLIEGAGQLVGFNDLRIKSNLKDPMNPKASVDLSVQSFVFKDEGEEENYEPWRIPDYDKMTGNLGRDIFALPSDLAKSAAKGGGKTMTTLLNGKEELPAWTKFIQFTGISDFGHGRPMAQFFNKSQRSTACLFVGDAIFDTGATITNIDTMNQTVTTEQDGVASTHRLRSYGNLAEMLGKPFSFQPIGLEGVVIPGMETNAAAAALAGDLSSTNAAAVAAAAAAQTEAAAEDGLTVNPEKTVVPEEYEKPLGNSTECMLQSGLRVIKVDPVMRKRSRYIKAEFGMLVNKVQKLGPGDTAGLHDNDVIQEIGGLRVDSLASYTYAFNKAYGQGGPISIKYQRGTSIGEAVLDITPKNNK